MPGLTLVTLGLAVLVATAVAGVLQADAARRILQDHDPHNEGRLVTSALGWLAAGAILAIIGGPLVSWVVLVEVLR